MAYSYFSHPELFIPPIRRAAYSDRTAWLMAEMSKLAYLKFENGTQELKAALAKAQFTLIEPVFNAGGTQAFLAKREADRIAVLASPGTEKEDPKDIIADLNARFYTGAQGVRIHDGFYRAFHSVEKNVRAACAGLKDHALYVTGHSLGGALALVAARALNSDDLAACYTFGSPMVGGKEFDDDIKPSIYRIVNACDIVPFAPSYLVQALSLIRVRWLENFLAKYKGYEHHGDLRYLTRCGDDLHDLDVVSNYNDLFRLFDAFRNRKELIASHDLDTYRKKLAHWALKRLEVK